MIGFRKKGPNIDGTWKRVLPHESHEETEFLQILDGDILEFLLELREQCPSMRKAIFPGTISITPERFKQSLNVGAIVAFIIASNATRRAMCDHMESFHADIRRRIEVIRLTTVFH